jgi:hypothetical protein
MFDVHIDVDEKESHHTTPLPRQRATTPHRIAIGVGGEVEELLN